MISSFRLIHKLKRTFTIAAMQQERPPLGLLLDVDLRNAEFFSTQMNITKSNDLSKDEKYIYNALMDDVVEKASTVDETLKQIVPRAKSFMQSVMEQRQISMRSEKYH
eukprot:gene27578-36379_t